MRPDTYIHIYKHSPRRGTHITINVGLAQARPNNIRVPYSIGDFKIIDVSIIKGYHWYKGLMINSKSECIVNQCAQMYFACTSVQLLKQISNDYL